MNKNYKNFNPDSDELPWEKSDREVQDSKDREIYAEQKYQQQKERELEDANPS